MVPLLYAANSSSDLCHRSVATQLRQELIQPWQILRRSYPLSKAMAMMSGCPGCRPFPPRGVLTTGLRPRGSAEGAWSYWRNCVQVGEEFSDLASKAAIRPRQRRVRDAAGCIQALRAWNQSVRNHDVAAYTVAGQEQGLNRPAKQNRCRRQTERLLCFFLGGTFLARVERYAIAQGICTNHGPAPRSRGTSAAVPSLLDETEYHENRLEVRCRGRACSSSHRTRLRGRDAAVSPHFAAARFAYHLAMNALGVVIILVTPAFGLFILQRSGARLPGWLSFWTFAYIVYLIYLGTSPAVGTSNGSEPQRAQAAGLPSWIDWALLVWWGIDVVLALTVGGTTGPIRLVRGALHVVVFAVLLARSLEADAWYLHALGILMVLAALVFALLRVVLVEFDRNSLAGRLFIAAFDVVDRFIPWHRLPTPVAVLNLAAFREVLRAKNLHNTSDIPVSRPENLAATPAFQPEFIVRTAHRRLLQRPEQAADGQCQRAGRCDARQHGLHAQ